MISNIAAWPTKASEQIKISFNSLPTYSLNPEKKISFADLKGKVVLVDFWASWCEPCKEALPHYVELFNKYGPEKVVIIGINADEDPKERDSYLNKNKIPFPLYSDPERKMIKDFKVLAIPTLIVFDRNLRPIEQIRGYSEKKIQKIKNLVEELLKSDPS
jgi:thiol-disulfide isomerase/thioredoxin